MKALMISVFLFALLISTKSLATHNHGGEILVEQTGPLSIKATIVTYTRTALLPPDRSMLTICWGDGSSENVQRSNGTGEILDDGTFKKNTYTSTHTFTTIGKYTVCMTDVNRNGGILNVNFPYSDAIPFHIQTTVTLVSAIGNQKYNSTPVFVNYNTAVGYVGSVFTLRNPITDADGDSVAYRLKTPFQSLHKLIQNYDEVNKIKPSSNNAITFDEKTGLFIWNSPQQQGAYTIAIAAISYRNGVAIDTTTRDLQIDIRLLNATNDLQETPLAQISSNPFSQEGILTFKENVGAVELFAFDLSGKMLLNIPLQNPQTYRLAKADLGSGVKLIKIKAARQEQVLKVVIE